MTRYVLTTGGDVVEFTEANYWKQKGDWVKIMDEKHGSIHGFFRAQNIVGVFATDDFNINNVNTNQ